MFVRTSTTIKCLILAGVCLAAFQNCGAPKGSGASDASSTGTGSPGTTATAKPAAPSQLTYKTPASTQVNLSWIDNSTNESGFKVERLAPGGSGPFVSANVWVLVATVTANSTTYSDKSVVGGASYSYRVSATNNVGDSPTTSVVQVQTPANPTSAPSAPSNLAATPFAATIVNLTWNDNSNNEGYFKLERSADNGTTWTFVGAPDLNATAYQDINLNPASTYVYRIRATNSIGDSANSANATVTTMAAGNMNTFTYVNTNIITPNCVACHGGAQVAAGINVNGFANLKANLAASRASINGNGMPPGAPLTATQKNAITGWANAGAPNN